MFKTHCIYSQYAFNLSQICAVENPTKKRCQNTCCFNFWIIKYVALWEEVRVMLCAFSLIPVSLWNFRIHERWLALLNRVWWLIEKELTWCQDAISNIWSVVGRHFWKFDIKLFNFVSANPCCKFIIVLFEANLIQTQIQNYFMKVMNILLTNIFWCNCSWKDKHRRFDKNNIYDIAFCIYF